MKINWRKVIWVLFGWHTWDYRNPYARTCRVCGRIEHSFCSSMSTWNKAWWESMHDGDESKHYTKADQ